MNPTIHAPAQWQADVYINQLERQLHPAPPAQQVSLIPTWLVAVILLTSAAFYAGIGFVLWGLL